MPLWLHQDGREPSAPPQLQVCSDDGLQMLGIGFHGAAESNAPPQEQLTDIEGGASPAGGTHKNMSVFLGVRLTDSC